MYLPFESRSGSDFLTGFMQRGGGRTKLQGGNKSCYRGMRGDQNFPSWWAPVVDVGCVMSKERAFAQGEVEEIKKGKERR